MPLPTAAELRATTSSPPAVYPEQVPSPATDSAQVVERLHVAFTARAENAARRGHTGIRMKISRRVSREIVKAWAAELEAAGYQVILELVDGLPAHAAISWERPG